MPPGDDPLILTPLSYLTRAEALLTQLRTKESQASLLRLLALEVKVAKEFEKTKKKGKP
ncbi:hypothetical protein P4S72_25075 [Vibrio sp. PP-XX7]